VLKERTLTGASYEINTMEQKKTSTTTTHASATRKRLCSGWPKKASHVQIPLRAGCMNVTEISVTLEIISRQSTETTNCLFLAMIFLLFLHEPCYIDVFDLYFVLGQL